MITVSELLGRLQRAVDLGLTNRIVRLVRRIRRLRRGYRKLLTLSTASAVAIAVLLPVVLQYCGGSADPNAPVSDATAQCAANLLAAVVDPEDSSPEDVALVNQMLSDALAADPTALTLAPDGNGSAPSGAGGSGSGSGSSSGSNNQFVLLVQDDGTPNGGSNDPGTPADPAIVGQSSSSFNGSLAGNLVRIEEDWQLVVTEPLPDRGAPQVGTIMTPFAQATDFYLEFAINHRFNPVYAAGGMELQLWYEGQPVGWVNVGEGVLDTPNETVSWTQRLEVQGNELRFDVVNGSSDTWGSFGQGESLHFSVLTNLTDLNDYHPSVSAANSGITFASNRVASLVLKAVRGYSASGELLAEDTTPVTVYSPPSE